MKNKKEDKIDRDESLDYNPSTDVSVDDQLKFKKTATDVTKIKKRRRIVFWSLAGASVAGIITLAVVLPKSLVELKLWSNFAPTFISKNAPVEIIDWNKNKDQKITGEPYSLMAKLLENPTLNNDVLQTLNIKVNDKYTTQLVNPMLDLINKNSLHFDVILKNKENEKEKLVIRNFTIYTSEEITKYNDEKIKQFNQNNKIDDLAVREWPFHFFTNVEFKPSGENQLIIPKIKEIIDNVNSLNEQEFNYIDKGLILTKYNQIGHNYFSLFESEEQSIFVPFNFNGAIELFKNEETSHYSLKFNALFYSLAKEKITIGKSKYEYGIYIPSSIQKDFESPIIFKKVSPRN